MPLPIGLGFTKPMTLCNNRGSNNFSFLPTFTNRLIFSRGCAALRDPLFCPASSPDFISLCQKGRDFSSPVGKLERKFASHSSRL